MSKIFEALKRGPDPLSDIDFACVLGEDPTTIGAASPDPEQSPLVSLREHWSPATVETVPSEARALAPATEFRQPGATDYSISFDAIQTVSLRVPESAPILPFDGSNVRAGEQYRSLRTKINLHPKQPKMILVSSASPGDGKSTTVVNLAGALALKSESEGRVLLLEADFRRSTLHKLLGTPDTPGLADVLSGHCRLEDAIRRSAQIPNLFLLPAGKPALNPSELLDSALWAAVCKTCRSAFRYIITDSPPIDAVSDYDLIQAACDGVIVVARPDHSDRQLCLKALRSVPKNKLLGVVLNGLSPWWLRKLPGYGSYYYTYGNGGAEPAVQKV